MEEKKKKIKGVATWEMWEDGSISARHQRRVRAVQVTTRGQGLFDENAPLVWNGSFWEVVWDGGVKCKGDFSKIKKM